MDVTTGTTATTLPQLTGTRFVTDGGMETDLIFHHGIDLPEFAAFPLIESATGRELLWAYYQAYADIAARAGCGLLLESPTWRANPDWAARLGYDIDRVVIANRAAVEFLLEFRGSRVDDPGPISISGMIGPRADGYRPGAPTTVAEATAYHRPQLAALAEAGADLAAAYTLIDPAEGIGIVTAARQVGLPIALSFTVETDGRCPDGRPLAETLAIVDAAAAPDYYQLNCAHPDHLLRALQASGAWQERIIGIRANASRASHAELDEAVDLDDGDPADFAAGYEALAAVLPNLTIRGGCCGTDARHVAALWGVEPPGTGSIS